MTNYVTIKTPEGDTVDIAVEELGSVGKMRMAAKAPSSMSQKSPSDIQATPEVVDFLIDLVEEQTILNEELIEELDHDQTSKLLDGVVAYSFGKEPQFEKDSTDETIEFT